LADGAEVLRRSPRHAAVRALPARELSAPVQAQARQSTREQARRLDDWGGACSHPLRRAHPSAGVT